MKVAIHLLDRREKAELERQGAKAAARGDDPRSNPLGRPVNLPTATGESTDAWTMRHRAWQAGYDSQRGEDSVH